MLIKEMPYKIKKQVKLSITTAESNTDINGDAVYLHNVGDYTVYIDNATGVTTDDWEIRPGNILGPLTVNTKFYFKGDGNTTLKVLFIEV